MPESSNAVFELESVRRARSEAQHVWFEGKTFNRVVEVADRLFGFNHAYRSRPQPQPSRYAIIERTLPGRVFIKAATPNSKSEYVRGQLAYQAGVRTGLFQAPKPLALLEEERLIIWEHLENLAGLRNYLIRHIQRHPQAKEFRFRLMYRIGEVLAALHGAFSQLDATIETRPIAEFHSPSLQFNQRAIGILRQSPLRAPHGDFGCSNLFVLEKPGADVLLVVLDPVPNHYLFPAIPTEFLCSVYIDAAQWFHSLRFHRTTYSWIKEEAADYLDHFISGYLAAGGARLDQPTLLACTAEVALLYQASSDKARAPFAFGEWCDRRFRLESVPHLFAEAVARTLPDHAA
jgi:hypothetical protein